MLLSAAVGVARNVGYWIEEPAGAVGDVYGGPLKVARHESPLDAAHSTHPELSLHAAVVRIGSRVGVRQTYAAFVSHEHQRPVEA